MSAHALIDRDDSILIVIDAQPVFLDKLPAAERRPLLDYMCWLIGVANWLRIPLVVTAEDIPHAGSVAPEIAQMLPAAPETPIHNNKNATPCSGRSIPSCARSVASGTACRRSSVTCGSSCRSGQQAI